MTAGRAGERLRLLAASAFGLGLSPVLPGSCGALLGVAIHVGIALGLPAPWQLPALVAALGLVIGVHVVLTPWAQRRWNDPDPKEFVLDEVAGYLLVPVLFRHGPLAETVLWGFVAFRVLDMVKVPPAWQIDRRMHGALGVVLDDLVSACYAALVLYGARAAGWAFRQG